MNSITSPNRTPSATANASDVKNSKHPLAAVTKRLRIVAGLIFGFSLMINLLMLVTPIYSTQIYNRVLTSFNTYTLISLTAIVLFLIVILNVFSAVRSSMQQKIGDWFERTVLPDVVQSGLKGEFTGVSISQVTREVQTIRQFISSSVCTTFFDAPWCLIFGLALWAIHPYLFFMTLGGGILLLILAGFGEWANRDAVEQQEQNMRNHNLWMDRLGRNSLTIRSMRLDRFLMKRWSKSTDDLLEHNAAIEKRSKWVGIMAQSVRGSLQISMIGFSAWLIIQHEMTAGSIIAVSMLGSRFIAPFEQALGAWLNVLKARAAYDRLAKIMQVPNIPDTMDLPNLKGNISVKGLYYRPAVGGNPILKNLSFDVNGGECIAIIGPSGSGKSTLLHTLAAVQRPSAGSVRIDGAEMWQQNPSLGDRIGFLSQSVEFFPGTIKENIARMNLEIDEQEVLRVSQLVGVHSLILSFAEGYETQLESDKGNLSWGQKQRIGLARAFYGNPKVIFLDEPNAHLDEQGESFLMQALRYAKDQGITVFIVSHKPNILQHVDRCLVIQDGELKDFADTKSIREKYTRANMTPVPQAARS